MRPLVLMCLILTVLQGRSQTIAGKVYELHTRIHLPEITVTNLKLGVETKTDSAGRFRIVARAGDILTFEGFAYQKDTVLIIDKSSREVFLQLKPNMLNEVKVNSAPVNLGEFRHPDFHGQTVVYQRDEDGFPIGGIAFRLSYWNKDGKKERRAKKRLADAAVLKEIDQIFNQVNIGEYIPLKGSELQDFIHLYRPTLSQYQSSNFDLLSYLNEKYKEFVHLPPEKRKLPALTN